MKRKRVLPLLLALSLLLSASAPSRAAEEVAGPETQEKQEDGFIQWVEFDVPYGALKKAMELDIASQTTDPPLSWTELLAGLAAQYWGNWKKYRSSDMDKLAEQ
jgi:hypothetical protein